MIYQIGLFLILISAGAYSYWLLIRERPTDRPAIENFAKERGLRIISVTRSYNYYRYFFRGIVVSTISSVTRLYDIEVEDSGGNYSEVHIAFEPLFGSGKLDVLEPKGLESVPQSGQVTLTQLDSGAERASLNWYEWLPVLGVCAGFSGFFLAAHCNYIFPQNGRCFLTKRSVTRIS